MSKRQSFIATLGELKSPDSDIRFMAFNDLHDHLTHNYAMLATDPSLTQVIVSEILDKLSDNISDVQNQAARCLEPLAKHANDETIRSIIEFLQTQLKSVTTAATATSETSTQLAILGMALRNVIANVPASWAVANLLAQTILPTLYKSQTEQSIESMDVLIDLIKRFGSSFSSADIDRSLGVIVGILSDTNGGLVLKRAVVALGLLSRYLTDAQWTSMMSFIDSGLSEPDSITGRSLIQAVGVLARAQPTRMQASMPEVLPKLLTTMKLDELDVDDDTDATESYLEVREVTLISLESLVSLGYQSIEPFIPQLLTACELFLKFNPNYVQEDLEDDGDDDVDMEGEDDDDNGDFDDFDLDEDAFTDDEDRSWKLRRLAAKLAAALVASSAPELPNVYSHLLKRLVVMLGSEQEETVKLEVQATLGSFILAAADDGLYYRSKVSGRRRNSDVSMGLQGDPQETLRGYLPSISKVALKDLSKAVTSIPITQGYLRSILSNLMTVVHGLDDLEEVVPALASLVQSKPSVMLDVLHLVSTILRTHSAAELEGLLPSLVDLVGLGIADTYYKVAAEALDVSLDVLALYSSGEQLGIPVESLQGKITEKANTTSLDFEVREKAVRALAELLASAPISEANFNNGCDVVLQLLTGSELLRVPAIRATERVSRASQSPTQEWIVESVKTLSSFLNRSSQMLRLLSLEAVLAVVGLTDGASDAEIVEALTTTGQLVLQYGSSAGPVTVHELSIAAQILDLLVAYLPKEDLGKFAIMLASKEEAVSVDAEMRGSLLGLLRGIASADEGEAAQLAHRLDQIGAEQSAPDLTAEALAVVISSSHLVSLVPSFDSISALPVSKRIWPLLVLGNVGKREQLTQDLGPLYDELENGTDEGLRLAVAQTVGRIVGNSVNRNLEDFLNRLQAAGSTESKKSAYFYVVAAHQVILGGKVDAEAEQIWVQLLQLARDMDVPGSASEGTGNEGSVLAECIGRLSIVSPEEFLPQLKVNLASTRVSMRYTVLAAVKYTFGHSTDDQRYDELLRPMVADFLGLMTDEDIRIRQISLSALVSAIHNKAHLLAPHLSRLLPLLYQETQINEQLVRKVQMGPFKHTVDDGLDLRKTAYETLYTLINAFPVEELLAFGMLDELLDRVIQGLGDDQDIKVLSCVIIGQLATVALGALTAQGRLDQVMSKLTGLLGITVKENAIKQEFEKKGEIVRNVERATDQINEAITSAAARGDATGLSDIELSAWNEFYHKVRGVKN